MATKSKETTANKVETVVNSVPFVFEITLEWTAKTPQKGGTRKEVKSQVARLTDGFTAKDAAKAAASMLYAVAISEKSEAGKTIRKPIAGSTCKTVYKISYAVVKSEVAKAGERLTSERRKLFEFEKSLNSSNASAGRWLNEVKGYLKAAFEGAELPADAKDYFQAANDARKRAQDAAKKAAKTRAERAKAKEQKQAEKPQVRANKSRRQQKQAA